MTVVRRRFPKGIILTESADAGTAQGEVRVDSSDDKLKVFLDGSERAAVTENQTQTLTNKTIDADLNTIIDLTVTSLKAGVLDIDLTSVSASDDTIPSAKAVKTYVDAQIATVGDAAGITYDNSTSGLAATNVQDAIDEVDGDLDAHIADISTHGTVSAIVGISDAQTLTNKTINAPDNTITNLADTNIAVTADITRTKLAPGTAAHVLINDGAGEISSEATLAKVRGGTGADNSSVTFPATGVIVTEAGSQTLTNKTIVAANNTISGLLHGTQVDNPSSGVHGVTGNVVGTSDTQVLTNKDIDGGTASNTSRFTLPKAAKSTLDALTRKEATLVYASDEDVVYVDNGTTLSEIGGEADPEDVSDKLNSSTGYFQLPQGTIAQRPGSPAVGMVRYNTDLDFFEGYQDGQWKELVTDAIDYEVEYLVVAGGGGGGEFIAGGGGAGGYRTNNGGVGVVVSPGSGYTVIVGAGGAAGNPGNGSNGGNSSFDTITSLGGGGGGNYGDPAGSAGNAGGSGGGGGNSENATAPLGGAGTVGQGFAGGDGRNRAASGDANYVAGGGGGAGAGGTTAAANKGGDGGIGKNTESTWATATSTGDGGYYAGGGGGSGNLTPGTQGIGGAGGGADGGTNGANPRTSAQVNTGGGGAGDRSIVGSAGGSGIVIVRYPGSAKGTGGTIVSSGGFTYHTFTSSGTFTA